MIKNRRALRKRDAKALIERFFDEWGIEFGDGLVEEGRINGTVIYMHDGHPIAIKYNDKLLPTLNILIAHRPQIKYITVDMGAVPHIVNGADVMMPGIVDFHAPFEKGDVLWVRDVKNKMPIAVGIALISSSEFGREKKGKALKNIHYVGDKIWNAIKGELG
ncbi:MAG: RNA-binding protein [Thermoplasmata archaeon]|nr:MAG: RNA-binding protein [Thermoplasmata archaeon]